MHTWREKRMLVIICSTNREICVVYDNSILIPNWSRSIRQKNSVCESDCISITRIAYGISINPHTTQFFFTDIENLLLIHSFIKVLVKFIYL
jgi:hypothetical protein